MNWLWVAPVTTVIGAGLALLGVWIGARQRDRADRRTEWREWFAIALGELANGTDPERRSVGIMILRSLTTSALAADEDRELAKAVIRDTTQNDRAIVLRADPSGLDAATKTWEHEGQECDGGAR